MSNPKKYRRLPPTSDCRGCEEYLVLSSSYNHLLRSIVAYRDRRRLISIQWMPVITDHPREKARPWSAKSTRVVFSSFSSSSSFSSYQFLHAVFSFCPIHSFSYHFPFLPLFPPFFLLFSCCNASDPWFSFWSLSPLLNLLPSFNSLAFKFHIITFLLIEHRQGGLFLLFFNFPPPLHIFPDITQAGWPPPGGTSHHSSKATERNSTRWIDISPNQSRHHKCLRQKEINLIRKSYLSTNEISTRNLTQELQCVFENFLGILMQRILLFGNSSMW